VARWALTIGLALIVYLLFGIAVPLPPL